MKSKKPKKTNKRKPPKKRFPLIEQEHPTGWLNKINVRAIKGRDIY